MDNKIVKCVLILLSVVCVSGLTFLIFSDIKTLNNILKNLSYTTGATENYLQNELTKYRNEYYLRIVLYLFSILIIGFYTVLYLIRNLKPLNQEMKNDYKAKKKAKLQDKLNKLN